MLVSQHTGTLIKTFAGHLVLATIPRVLVYFDCVNELDIFLFTYLYTFYGMCLYLQKQRIKELHKTNFGHLMLVNTKICVERFAHLVMFHLYAVFYYEES